MNQPEQENISAQEEVVVEQKPESNNPPKKLNSYTYWVDDKNKSRQLPVEQRPQKIDPPKLVTQKSQDGRSHWNTAGTWEHKTISLNDVQQQYTERVNEWVLKNAPQFILKKVSLKGECEIVFIRTKKALTYDINGTVQFQKKPQQKKPQQKQQDVAQKVQKKDSEQSSQDKSDKSLQKSDKSSQKSDQKSKIKSSKSKSKKRTMTFEIVDLTDHGDRQFKSKADEADDKKLISQQSQGLLVLLEDILKAYK